MNSERNQITSLPSANQHARRETMSVMSQGRLHISFILSDSLHFHFHFLLLHLPFSFWGAFSLFNANLRFMHINLNGKKHEKLNLLFCFLCSPAPPCLRTMKIMSLTLAVATVNTELYRVVLSCGCCVLSCACMNSTVVACLCAFLSSN